MAQRSVPHLLFITTVNIKQISVNIEQIPVSHFYHHVIIAQRSVPHSVAHKVCNGKGKILISMSLRHISDMVLFPRPLAYESMMWSHLATFIFSDFSITHF